MRSTLGMYGLALASLASFASAAVGLNSADADLSLNPDFSLEGTTGGDNYGVVRSALDSRGHEGAVFIFDKRGRPNTATIDVINDKFLEVDIPISWPTGATVGAQFGINVEFLVTDVDSHYLSPPVTSSDIVTGCSMHILATWGPQSVPRPGTANQPAFPRELWYGADLLPRTTTKVGEYDTRYGASVGLPLTVPENFESTAQNLIVHVRQVCAAVDTGTLPKVNDFMLTRVQAYLVNEVSEPVTTTTTSATSTTDEPVPTSTDEPVPTGTDEPVPTETDEPVPTGTDEPVPTGTDEPIPTGTDGPVPTETTDGPVTTGEPTGTPTGDDSTTTATTTTGPVPTGDAVLPGPVRIGDYKYAGCVSSPPPSAGTSPFVLAATRADNSLDVCAGICQTQNKTLSGTSGADCYCGNGDAATLSTVADAECDIPCPGNPAQSCGGRLLLSKRYLQARQAPPFGVLLTVYIFAPAADTTTTIALPTPTGSSGTTINNINNINNTNNNVNNVNISIMIPVTCLPGACETEVYYERVCEVCKPEEPAWRPIKCAGDACVDKVVCRPEPAPKCVDDCWVETPCHTCDGGVVYKPQAQVQAVAPEHPAVMPVDKTTSAPLPIYTAGAGAIAANMGSLVAALAPVALVFYA